MAWIKKKTKRSVTVTPQSENRLRYRIDNLQGIGARARQEDSFMLVNALDEQQYDNYGLMFAVCDGMGGMKDGKLASETALISFRRFFSEMDRTGRIAMQLQKSLFDASHEIESLLKGDGGSTVVIGIILHEQLYFASVGDSYFYLRRDGQLYRLNREQNVCQQRYLENIRDGIMSPKECREDSEAASLTQFLGMCGFSEADCTIRPMFLHKGDILLACSDGVGGTLDEKEIMDALDCPQKACCRMEQRILEHANLNQDNYTAVIINCV